MRSKNGLIFSLSEVKQLPLSFDDEKTWGLAKALPYTIPAEVISRFYAAFNILLGRGVCVKYKKYENKSSG